MAVKVRLFANFREAAGVSEVQFNGVKSLSELLDALVEKFGKRMADEIYRSGEVRSTVNVALNGRALRLPQDLGFALEDGDSVAIFPPISGG